jgi:cytochrome c553
MIKIKAMGAILLVSLLFFGCTDTTTDTTTTDTTTDTTTTDTINDVETEVTDTTVTVPESTVISKYTPDEGRLLASQCFQCHGTNGVSTNSWDSIAGEGNLHQEMFEDDAPIMLSQAKGYTDAEISLIEGYLTSVPKSSDDNDDENEEDEDNEEDND